MTFPAKITSDLAALNTGIAAVKPPKVTQAQVTVLKNASTAISTDLTAAFKASDDALLVATNGLNAMTAQAAALKQQVTDTNQLLLVAQSALAAANVKIAALETQIANQPPLPAMQAETRTLPCPDGQTGQIIQKRNVTAWQTTSSNCTPIVVVPPEPPPVIVPPVVIPPIPSSQPGVTIISHPAVPRWAQGMKHVTATFHPPSGRIYYNNGDYRGYDNKYEMSYQQETGSFDIAIILAQGPNAPDAFRLEYPYEGFGGTTAQPKHPDFCAFPWDESRNVFWLVPGQTANSTSNNAPGETSSGTDDPCFKNGIWQFDPAKPIEQRWKFITSDYGTGSPETWMSIWDPKNDVLIRCGQEYINIFDCKTEKWQTGAGSPDGQHWYPLLGGIRSVSKEYLAVDLANRKFYAMDSVLKKCFCISMDAPFAVEDCSEQPGLKLPMENYEYMVFNSKHNLLEYNNEQEAVIYVADATVRPLVWKVGARGVWCRAAVYDSKNDRSLWFGGLNDAAGGGNPNMTLFEAMKSSVFL